MESVAELLDEVLVVVQVRAVHALKDGVRQLVPERLLQSRELERYAVVRLTRQRDGALGVVDFPHVQAITHRFCDLHAVPVVPHFDLLG